MNWNQAKKKYPKLKPFGDIDRDGVRNIFDCRPFNKRLQGAGKYFMVYNKEKEYGLVHGRERLRSARRILKNKGVKGIRSYEYDYED